MELCERIIMYKCACVHSHFSIVFWFVSYLFLYGRIHTSNYNFLSMILEIHFPLFHILLCIIVLLVCVMLRTTRKAVVLSKQNDVISSFIVWNTHIYNCFVSILYAFFTFFKFVNIV